MKSFEKIDGGYPPKKNTHYWEGVRLIFDLIRIYFSMIAVILSKNSVRTPSMYGPDTLFPQSSRICLEKQDICLVSRTPEVSDQKFLT